MKQVLILLIIAITLSGASCNIKTGKNDSNQNNDSSTTNISDTNNGMPLDGNPSCTVLNDTTD